MDKEEIRDWNIEKKNGANSILPPFNLAVKNGFTIIIPNSVTSYKPIVLMWGFLLDTVDCILIVYWLYINLLNKKS